ncbi:MMPL family transporter [Streptomyces sp. SID8366]|uniref:MMPL family transporter n=1 Tax=unclassified Streptomyces TaxID=2593676 RepID=UPI000DB8FB5D|nr:MMPL family transporter [Streptomyces sp. PsTaAH-130]MYU03911.1 MMPL family transporter [Streptomyces sp. SID8366]MYU65861.1 MMPL family transporter [Streptomyces sp. SID69]RAJ49941.1 RND superfamily putative drug exporter [Streptomyces sp. PsTaAH-130]
MAALARWCVRHRLIAVLLWLCAFGGATAAASVAGTSYSNDYSVPGTESGRAAQLLHDGFPGLGGDSDTVVWHTAKGTVRTAGVEQSMTTALDRIARLPGVASVDGPYDGQGGRQISADGHTAYATVTFARQAEDIGRNEAQAVVSTAKAAGGDGLQVELGGSAIGLTETPDDRTAEVVGVLVAAVVLFLAFGSLAASLLPIATALIGVGTAHAGIGLLGHAMTVADFAPMLGMLVGLGVGIDYALFIVTRHRRGLKRGLDVTEAAVNAVATTGRAVVFAGATVCIALLGMLILRLSFLNGVAVAASLTVVLTVAASVTLLPALLSYIGPRALGRRERRRLTEHGPRPEVPTGLAARWSALVERRPRLLGALAVAVIALLALPTLSLHLGTSDQGNDPRTSTTRKAYDLLADGFGHGVNGPLTLVTRVDGAADRLALDNLDTTLRATPGVASATPVAYATGGESAYLTVVPDSAPQSQRTSALVDRLRETVLPRAEQGTSLDIQVGGVTASYDDFADVIVGKLPLFVGTVIGLGCLLLLVAFRSLGIPLKAAVMNIAAVAAAFGVVVAIFQWGWGSELLGLGRAGPIEPFLPVIMVSVLFGLSMDYQVFLVSRMYEEWLATGDNRRAVRVGLAETSRVINSAAVIMISVFLAFVLSGDRVIAMFGIALAAAVALDAFVLRTLLVPALMHLLGAANWWLPGWLDRGLPRISIEPPECRAAHERLGPVPDDRTGRDRIHEQQKEAQRDVRDIPG